MPERIDPITREIVQNALAAMPGGRCPVPPSDRPGPGDGLDGAGHWIGRA